MFPGTRPGAPRTMESGVGIQAGDVIAGKYVVERVLGIGGMGVVVAARHQGLDERVAVKFLQPMLAGHAHAVARFTREARAAVKIKSEHVAKVYDVGELETGTPYIIMEYLEGSDLAHWLSERGVLPIEQAVEFVLEACEAIAEAHALGIVHRDLKPGNLFVVHSIHGSYSIKVLDFGISKLTNSMRLGDGGPVTRTAEFIGSPRYMSPEQMRSSKDVDARTDVWSLGVILYELLAGTCPFAADNLPDLALRVVHADPARLRDQRREVPSGLEQVIRKCLEKTPQERYRSVRELAMALSPFASKRAQSSIQRISAIGEPISGLAVTADSPGSPFSESTGPHGTLRVSDGLRRRSSRRTRWLLAGATAAVAATALAIKIARPLWGGVEPPSSAATTEATPPKPEPQVEPPSSAATTEATPAKPEPQVLVEPAPSAEPAGHALPSNNALPRTKATPAPSPAPAPTLTIAPTSASASTGSRGSRAAHDTRVAEKPSPIPKAKPTETGSPAQPAGSDIFRDRK